MRIRSGAVWFCWLLLSGVFAIAAGREAWSLWSGMTARAQSLQRQVVMLRSETLQGSQQHIAALLASFNTTIAVLHSDTGSSGYYSNLRRLSQELLQQQLESQPDWQALTVVWKRDGFGEADEVFVGDAEFGSNDSGRFAGEWRRQSDNITIQHHILSEEEIEIAQAEPAWRALTCVRQQQRLCMYQLGSSLLVALPLRSKNDIEGVLGVEVAPWPAPDVAADIDWVGPLSIAPADSAITRWQAPDGSQWGVAVTGAEQKPEVGSLLWWCAGFVLVQLIPWSGLWRRQGKT